MGLLIMSWKKTAQNIVLSLLVALAMPAAASATCAAGVQSCGTTYEVGETYFGSGGNLNSCGTTYCSKQSAGETAVGNPKGTTYQARAGFNTDRSPYLEFAITSGNINLGVLTIGQAATGTGSFYVKTYLASGYVVTNASATTPTYRTHTIPGMSTTSAFSSTTEEFGINLVANNGCAGSPGNGIPATLGANPLQVPSGSFSFGAAAAGYNTACQFRYVNGETIASYSGSSGETDYTISYLVNITGQTPAGLYTMNHVLVATSTF